MSFRTIIRRFRFTLREILLATAVLAVGFTWPLLMVIIMPVLLVAVLSRLGMSNLAPVATAAVLSLTIGVVFSLLYWRFPFRPPRLLAELRSVNDVEQLSRVYGLNPQRGAAEITAVVDIPSADTLSWNTETELMPTERIIQNWIQDSPTLKSTEAIAAEFAKAIWHAADKAGILLDGSPERTDTKSLSGYIGIVRSEAGKRFAFATLAGNEYSNDHYPYYEFVIPLDGDGFEISNSQWFFFDVAGMEGTTWYGVAAASFIVLFPAAIILLIVISATKQNLPYVTNRPYADFQRAK
jgi:hypothetical protein